MPFQIKSPLEIDARDIDKIVAAIKNFKNKDQRIIDCHKIVDKDNTEKIVITMGGEEIITFSRDNNGSFQITSLKPRHGSIKTTHIVLIGLFRDFTNTEIAVNP